MQRPAWWGAAFLGAVLLLSFLVHRAAFQGYFEDDDLSTFPWARSVSLVDLVRDIPSLKYPPEHARPTGYFYFTALYRGAGLDYPPYVAVLQAIHVLNICLLWLLLRRLGLDPIPAATGCLFFAMHRALFDAWWKPMFIYDVLCTTFALASLLAYVCRRWVLSFVAFWLAMRSKEVGIVVPAILLWYELTAGSRNWKRVLPFFVPALIYGAYGLVYNLHQHSSYSFRFEGPSLQKAVAFYASRMIQITYAGFFLLLLPLIAPDKRAWFGTGALVLGLAIYLLLPGRLLEIYLYLAMTGAAVAIAAAAQRKPQVALVLVLIWTGWQYLQIRKHAVRTLAEADERRAYVSALHQAPDAPVYIYDLIPWSMHSWGVDGALRIYHPNVSKVHRLEDDGLPTEGPMQFLTWDAKSRRLLAAPFSVEGAAQVKMDGHTPAWQLPAGWQDPVDGYRTIGKHATARLYRRGSDGRFTWQACGKGELAISIGGEPLPAQRLDGCTSGAVDRKPATGLVGVDFRAESREPVRIGNFGFAPAMR
jgi:hypothetical protein